MKKTERQYDIPEYNPNDWIPIAPTIEYPHYKKPALYNPIPTFPPSKKPALYNPIPTFPPSKIKSRSKKRKRGIRFTEKKKTPRLTPSEKEEVKRLTPGSLTPKPLLSVIPSQRVQMRKKLYQIVQEIKQLQRIPFPLLTPVQKNKLRQLQAQEYDLRVKLLSSNESEGYQDFPSEIRQIPFLGELERRELWALLNKSKS